MTSEQSQLSDFDRLLRLSIAGGFAGGVAKTAVAPLDRVKILFQTHHKEFAQFAGSWKGIGGALNHILRTHGFTGLYRGHSLTLARAVPHAAIGYTVYEYVRQVLMPTRESQTYTRRMIVGSITGLSVLPFVYPFELVRVRMAIETKQTRVAPSVWSVFKGIYSDPSSSRSNFPKGILHFYRGFTVTALGTVPYRGGIFLVVQTLDAWCQDHLSPEFRASYFNTINLTNGAVAGTTAQVATYPLEVIRRMQQASGGLGTGSSLTSREAVKAVLRSGGWRGFYAGLGIGLVKQVPMHSISWTVWQASKKFLGV